MKMRAARMYGYKQPLRLEEVEVPAPAPEEVLVRVGGAGMCRTDFQLVDGYFDNGLAMDFPITPGHEVAGWVDGVGSAVPRSAGLAEGDQVVVFGSWGDENLKIAHENGADHVINVRDKDAGAVRAELESATGRTELDAVIECAGSEESIRLGFALLASEGAVAPVGLIGNRIDIPLFPLVAREYTYFGSFWGNYNDLTEVLALAQAGQIKHSVTRSASTTSTRPWKRSPAETFSGVR